ncbi:thiamine/thiamine pyrophosphate ABC transporter permease ThiP [Actinobacillus arthritidis]|uniref:thiamine/thiamine pyrophosphate ABC transporter permease ThiP n=1 Tax=Actinobacillus arthritidis TaxID=157339 RepID=UPI0024411CE6|nr:thiamine/thiamine pyrophosphate ABC transporter permease ThiP [Actinobacillus arthritidis]WGE88827.1 thiamine/thiamine pyrophosphate ABC transporter permease ThiP [Actinobacillus arthritidis]
MFRSISKITAWSIFILVVGLYVFSLNALMQYRQAETLWQFSEVLPILKYSFLQASLSAFFAVVLGALLARAFFYLDFVGKSLLYKSITLVWALPSLVVIFAVIGFWGSSGWIAQIMHFFMVKWEVQLYGLNGILIAHILFNLPLVMKYSLEGLNLIPSSQHRLGAQLGLKSWQYFRIVELPILKGILPYAFTNVFLICFTSFPIVLMLGGSPKYSTLEVAIYQAVTFEFDFAKAVMLILIQFALGSVLQFLMSLTTKFAFNHTKQYAPVVDMIWKPKPLGWRKLGLQIILVLQSLFIILPLASVVWSGISVSNLSERLLNSALWDAVWFSFLLSLIAAFTVLCLAYLLALETRQLAFRQKNGLYALLAGVINYPLILPVFLLAVGLFLIFMEIELTTSDLLWIVGICNGLTLLPYIYQLIFAAMWHSLTAQDKLARSLGLTGLRHWWIVEKTYLIRPLANAFALAMSSSLGSFTVIAFFGSPDFSSLPYLLYQQLGSYRTEDAAVTALVLMLFTLLPFLFIDQHEKIR